MIYFTTLYVSRSLSLSHSLFRSLCLSLSLSLSMYLYAPLSLSPSLALPQVVSLRYRGFSVPRTLANLWRYLDMAYAREEFSSTCPADAEIHMAYASVAKALK